MYTNIVKPKNMVKIVLTMIALWLISAAISTTFSSGAESDYNGYEDDDIQYGATQSQDDYGFLWLDNLAEDQEIDVEEWEEWEEFINIEELIEDLEEAERYLEEWGVPEENRSEVEDFEWIAPNSVQMARNDYPIVFVNSFLFSWEADELGPLHPWGGLSSIPDFLTEQGFRVLEPVIGPFSSNRHRAIELYYFLKGGTVDYGAYQASTYGHARFGRTFPGIFPEWDDEARVHLIGFSMGGLTAREIANLIAEGCEREIAFHQQNPHLEISPLLAGETTGGIHSITTIGAPNNGLSFVSERNIIIPFAQRMLRLVVSLSGLAPNRIFFDFRFDHFLLRRGPDESFASYADRAFASPIWRTQNTAFRDLRVGGVTANAVNLQTRPDIYYFSHTGQTTTRMLFVERPLLTTDLILIPSTLFTIAHRDSNTNPVIDRRWAPSDGMVSTISSIHPFGHPARPYDGNPVRGVWNHHPVMHGWDHSSLHGYGFSRTTDEVNQFYLSIARRLQSLPRYYQYTSY